MLCFSLSDGLGMACYALALQTAQRRQVDLNKAFAVSGWRVSIAVQ